MLKQEHALSVFPNSPLQQQGQKIINDALHQFPILIRSNVQLLKTPKHTNPCLEIVITQSGRSAFLSRGKLLLNKHRHVLLHNAQRPHQFISLGDKSFRCTALYIDYKLLSHNFYFLDWFNNINVLQMELDPLQYSHFMKLCKQLEALMTSKEQGWQQLAVSQLLQIAVLLERFSNQQNSQKLISQQEISSLVQQCVAYVCEHLEEKLTLEQMARKFSISREHLTRSFTKEVGVSFHQFVLSTRVDYAKQLLLDEPELTVIDIALLSGFATQSHFSNTFRRMAGCSPTQYRQSMAGIAEPSP